MTQKKRKNKQEPEEKKAEPIKPDWKVYLAIAIAALQTALLPFVLLVIALLVVAIAFGVLLR